jgi:hydrogenase maturation protease
MPRILIVGYGNPLRCDDGVGWHAAEELSRRLASEDVEIVTCHQLTPELADAVSHAEVAFFIDAARDGVPGTLACDPVVPEESSFAFTHQLSAGAVLDLAIGLYGRCARAFAVSLCGECFDHGEKLSVTVAENLARLVTLVQRTASNP